MYLRMSSWTTLLGTCEVNEVLMKKRVAIQKTPAVTMENVLVVKESMNLKNRSPATVESSCNLPIVIQLGACI